MNALTIPEPKGVSWDYWSNSMKDLFPDLQLSDMPEHQWRDWVDGLAGIDYFSKFGTPSSLGFDHWQGWAERFCGVWHA